MTNAAAPGANPLAEAWENLQEQADNFRIGATVLSGGTWNGYDLDDAVKATTDQVAEKLDPIGGFFAKWAERSSFFVLGIVLILIALFILASQSKTVQGVAKTAMLAA